MTYDNQRFKWRQAKYKRKCKNCGMMITNNSKRCKPCFNRYRAKKNKNIFYKIYKKIKRGIK